MTTSVRDDDGASSLSDRGLTEGQLKQLLSGVGRELHSNDLTFVTAHDPANPGTPRISAIDGILRLTEYADVEFFLERNHATGLLVLLAQLSASDPSPAVDAEVDVTARCIAKLFEGRTPLQLQELFDVGNRNENNEQIRSGFTPVERREIFAANEFEEPPDEEPTAEEPTALGAAASTQASRLEKLERRRSAPYGRQASDYEESSGGGTTKTHTRDYAGHARRGSELIDAQLPHITEENAALRLQRFGY
jgi:hypothetical protein